MTVPYKVEATPPSVAPDAPVHAPVVDDSRPIAVSNTLAQDADTITMFAAWLDHAKHGGCAEIRILNSPAYTESGFVGGGAHSGYFTDASKIALQISPWDGGHPNCGIYITANPIKSDLLARADHRMLKARTGGSSSAEDAVRLVHLVLDFDPIRPKDIPATAAELADALAVRDRAQERLAALGVHGATGTSGNGGYLILPTIGYPNTPENREAWGHVLDGLCSVFSTPTVKLDDALKDPSRVIRLLGTVNAKGTGTEGRPWRVSSFNDPGVIEPADLLGRADGILKALGAAPPTVVSVSRSTASTTPPVSTTPKRERKPVDPDDTRPGTDYNARTTWTELLTADGWTRHSEHGEETYWTRPGKDSSAGLSATTNYKGADVLKVFTSSAEPLKADQTYDRFGYFAATHHKGDHVAAARALAAQGYGAQAWSDPIPLDTAGKPPAFPAHVLPTWVREFVAGVATHHEVPADLPGLLALAAGSGAVSRRLTVHARGGGWREPTNLYVMVALPSGVSKTPVLTEVMQPIRDLEREYRKAYVEQCKPAPKEENEGDGGEDDEVAI